MWELFGSAFYRFDDDGAGQACGVDLQQDELALSPVDVIGDERNLPRERTMNKADFLQRLPEGRYRVGQSALSGCVAVGLLRDVIQKIHGAF